MQLLGTPSEEEWPGFTRRAAKIGLRIESTDKPQKSIESTDKPQKSPPPTSNVNKTKHSSTPAQDDPLASFMAQIENKTESLDESSTKDGESDTKEAESDTPDKEIVCSDTVAEDGSPDAANSTHVADAIASDGLQAQTDVAGAASSDGTVPIQNSINPMEIQPSENTSTTPDVEVAKTVESKGFDAASLHAARVACAASRFVHVMCFCWFLEYQQRARTRVELLTGGIAYKSSLQDKQSSPVVFSYSRKY